MKPTVQVATPQVVASPKVATVSTTYPKVATSYVPTTYAAQPLFWNRGTIFNNNFGGKADYDQSRYGSGYGHGGYYDNYAGHFHINDGWGLWDDDLYDRDSKKTDKFGSNKDGGR